MTVSLFPGWLDDVGGRVGGGQGAVCDLVQAVLDSKFSVSHPEDITDRVCLEIENDPDWLSEYHSLVEHFGSKGKNGLLTVNSSIGWFTKDLTGMKTTGRENRLRAV